MSFRGKYSKWIMGLLICAVIIFMMATSSKSALFDRVATWFDDYSEAVEAAQADEGEEDAAAEDSVPAGKMMVRIDDEIGEYAGVETVTLAETSFFPESKAMARVVDLQPMLAMRARYNQASAALAVNKVAEQSAAAEVTRLKKLAAGAGSVATKNINYARAVWREANVKLQGFNFELEAIHDEAVQTWGEVVANWVLAKDAKEWQRLLARRDSLLLVTLPIDVSLAAEVSFIRISRNGARQEARKAYYVSQALASDQLTQGETYYFKTASGKLRTGMRLDAWLPKGSEPLSGVFVPEKAVVWSEGQAWAYVQLEDELYQRRSLESALNASGGVFMMDEIKAGETLVISGAQMLLSEEFKWQIEDDD